MKKLDQFLLKSFLGPLVMVFLIVVFILVMQFLWLYIDDLVGKGLSFWVIIEYLWWASCTILPIALPLATLIASIMTLGNMGESNELLAMKAAGISLKRILTPLFFSTIFICVGAFFISNNLIPIAYNKIFTLQYDIGKTKEEIKIPTGTFYNGIDGYALRISDRNKESGMMYDVMVYNHSSNKGNVSLAVADSGLIKTTPDKTALIFTLFSGVSYEETNTRKYKDTSFVLQKIEFDRQEIIIPLENYAFKKSEGERYGNEVMSKNLALLRNDRDSIGTVYEDVYANQQKRIVYGTSLEYASQLDTARNKGLYKKIDEDSLMNWESSHDELKAVSDAIASIGLAISTLESFDRESNQYTYSLRRIDLESYRKFALSLACMVFFFIGAPLGAIIRKGGLGTPVIISALFFVLYWVVDISGKKLAKDGSMTPLLGAFISTLVLFPMGVFITWKAVKESSLFNIDTYTNSIRKFFNRLSDRKKDMKNTTRIVFMGTPEFAVGSLKALVEGGYNIAAVVTVPDKPSGRGLKMNTSAVKEYAIEKNLPILQPESLKDPVFLGTLRSLDADIFVVVAFRMLPEVVWSMPHRGTFNLHASLLPQYRGAAPINWAIINGEKETGVTTFLLDRQIDTGKILFQEHCPIEESDNIGTLYDKLMTMGSALVLKTVDALSHRNLSGMEQPAETVLRPAPKITRETCKIDWSHSAADISLLVRGLSPYPAAYAVMVCGDKKTDVKIYEAVPVREEGNIAPGAIISDGKTFLRIGCGSGCLDILSLQVAGKKRLSIKEYIAGIHNFTDLSFE